MQVGQSISNGASSIWKLLAASWDWLFFLGSIVIVAYAAGLATAHFRLPPYDTLQGLWGAGKDWAENWRMKLGLEPTGHLVVGRHEGAGVIQYAGSEASPGVTLMEGLFDGRVGLRLIDNQGTSLHTWDALYSEIAPNSEYIRENKIPANDWETMVQGAALYSNGDVLFNLAGASMTRMSACGDIVWTLPTVTHHSIYVADNGNIWTLGRKQYEQQAPEFPGMRPDFEDNPVLEVSPQGEILRQISLLGILYTNDLIGSLFPTGEGLIDGYAKSDILHANDVEVLSQHDAPAFPLFEAGDALVSVRNLNLLVVFNPDSGVVKWSQTGPWLRQHDADFLPDGRILVFDNRNDAAGGRLLGGSRLLAIDPVTREVETIYKGTPEAPFFSAAHGKADMLEDGNFLITETDAGRVFEVNPEGEIVWSFIHRYDAERLITVFGATRYPESFGRFDRSQCS
jgi:Arylsulfotransferase (ASST)